MSEKSDFRVASEEAELWASDLADVQYFANQGDMRVAYGLLLGLRLRVEKHGPALYDNKEHLAAVSDGVIRHHGLGGIRCYPSAHEAIVEVLNVVFLVLLSPLENIADTDEREATARRWFAEHGDGLSIDAALLRARISRERAKLLGCKPNRVPEAEPTAISPLSKKEERVLLYLLDNDGCLRQQPDIVASTDLSRSTVGGCLRTLTARRLVQNPSGPRKGYGLTELGREAAKQAAEHPGPADS